MKTICPRANRNCGTLKSVIAHLLLVCVALVSSVHAETLVVTNLADSGAGSLRLTLAEATSGDTITFAMPSPAVITLTSGQLEVSNSLSILGPGPNQLAIDGNGSNRVWYFAPGQTNLIAGLTITNGRALDTNYFGGGIYNQRGILTVSNCVISGNSANYSGGGIYNDRDFDGHAVLTILDSILAGNSASGGGGIGNGGGGISSDRDAVYATLTINNSTICSNSATSSLSGGGGIENSYGLLIASNCTIHGNSAAYAAGGIFNYGYSHAGPAANATIHNSTVSGNSAQYGGGIYNDGHYDGLALLTIQNSTLSDNSAVYRGGGIYGYGIGWGTAQVTIHNSTLSGNWANSGGGIYLYNFGGGYATLTVSHTLFAHGGLGQNIQRIGAAVTNLGYNLSDDTSTLPFATTTNLMLGPLMNNGGATLTHAPLPGSPAIDAGNPSFDGPPFSDQRGDGFLRLCNGRIDIGAVEAQMAFPPVLMNPTWDASSGRFQFSFANISGASFNVLTTTNPAQPLSNWNVLGGVLEISPGRYEYTNTNAPGPGSFFYRVGLQ